MSSKSKSVDTTSNKNETTVVDRRAVQERGQQILDSVIVSNDDRVIKSAMAEMRIMLDGLTSGNAVTVDRLANMTDKIMSWINKNQVDINTFGMQALETARRELSGLRASGDVLIRLADETVGQAMGMAERVALDQTRNQAQALQIIAETKTGDYAETLKSVSGMVMVFALIAIAILRETK